jgi:uncharacterized membrane protein YqjE
MDPSANSGPPLRELAKRLAQQALIVLENRLELLLVEAEEERERILRAVCLCLGAAVFGLLAAVALTAGVLLACWTWSPLAAALGLAALYGTGCVFLCVRLARLRREWKSLPATLAELRKDRACLETRLN